MLKPHNATILDLVNYLLQWFTHTKKNLLYLLQFWLVLEILVFCVDPSFSLMSLSLENFHISYKRDLLIFDSLSFCLSEELLFLHFWTLFHCVQILRNDSFFFFFLSAFGTNLLARLVSDETAAVVLTFFSDVKLPLLSGLSWLSASSDCPEWSHTFCHLTQSLPPWSSCTVGSPSFVTWAYVVALGGLTLAAPIQAASRVFHSVTHAQNNVPLASGGPRDGIWGVSAHRTPARAARWVSYLLFSSFMCVLAPC